jgi:hypothetical protein
MILECLEVPVKTENIGAIQSGAIMAIVDAFDRQIERNHFVMLCDYAMTLHGALGRMYTLLSMRQLAVSEDLNTGTIDHAVERLTEHAVMKQVQLRELMGKVAQCPTANDPVS